MTIKYFVYKIYEETPFNVTVTNFSKVQIQEFYNGFDSFDSAEQWINEHGENRINYTILPVYRHP